REDDRDVDLSRPERRQLGSDRSRVGGPGVQQRRRDREMSAPTPDSSRGRAARRRRLAGALLVGAALWLAAGPAVADQWTLRTGVHLDAWSANDSSGQGTGYQFLAPLAIYYDTPSWGLAARGSVGTSVHDLDNAPSASMSGLTDTTVS